MSSKRKIWSRVGIVTLASASMLTACSEHGEGEAESEHGEAGALHSQEHGEHAMSGEGESEGESEGVAAVGEGESEGESEGEGGSVNFASNDIAYLTQLGLMRGHLLVGYELYKAGHADAAKTHMKHPKAELYAGVESAFSARGTGGFATPLAALASAVEQERDAADVDTAYVAVVAAIAVNEHAVADKTKSAAGQLSRVAELLRLAGKEYAIAVVDGVMQNPHEYQDAYGFTQVAKQIINGVSDTRPAVEDAITKARDILDNLSPLWPGLMPPDALTTEASALYGAAAQIELLALGLDS